ncbi:MAG: hypothetical protein ACAI43_09290, partial [Phycisphaerae bacterium]
GDVNHPFIARNLKVWEAHYVLRPQLQYFLMDGLTVHEAVYGVYHPDYDAHVYRNVRMSKVNSEPINRGLDDTDEQRGTFTYENVTFEDCRGGRDPLIQMALSSPRAGQAGHFKNVVVRNSRSANNVVDLGGGPRNKTPEHPVVYYFHDYPAAGQTTKVVHAADPAVSQAGAEFQPVKDFTGKSVRAAKVKSVGFPTLLTPVDDVPPATMIRSVTRTGDKLRVTGVTHDNGDLAQVTVNGQPASVVSTSAGITDWQVEIAAPADGKVTATSKDATGNLEQMPHVVPVR